MKITRKTLPTLIILLFLGALAGGLAWEVIERIAVAAGVPFSLTTEQPLRLFDLYVLAVEVRANPGSLLGAAGAALLFRSI